MIVLDAVGAGALPDADQYGDEGSNTLANVAKAVGGLDLPNLEALGLGNVEPLEGCPPQPGAPAVAGRLLERSKGKDTTTGHWELMGVVTAAGVPDVSARLPARRDRPVHAPHRARRARQQAGVGHGDHPGARRGASEDGQVDRLHVRRLRLPDRGARGDGAARGALRGVPHRARDPHRQARRRPRDRAAVHRRAGQLRAHAEPARLLARAAAAELPLARARRRHDGARRRQDQRHLRGLRHRRVASDEVEHRRHPADREAARRSSTRASSSRTSSRPTRSGATGTTRSTSTAACRTSTGGCPTCSRRCGPGDLLILTSDHGCDPTTPSTDHSREHAMLLAYVAGRNAAGQIHEGEFADVGATVNAWLKGKAPSRGIPGQPILDAMKLDNPLLVRWEYASEERLAKRNAIFRALVEGDNPEDVAVRGGRRRPSRAAARRRLRPGRADASGSPTSSALDVRAIDISARMVELTRARGHRRPGRRRGAAAVRRRRLRLRVRRLGALPRARARAGDRRVRARASARTAGSSRRRYARTTCRELWDLIDAALEPREPLSFSHDERRGAAWPALRARRAAGRRGGLVFPDSDSMRDVRRVDDRPRASRAASARDHRAVPRDDAARRLRRGGGRGDSAPPS